MEVPTSGIWTVKTETSAYQFNFDRLTAVRIPDDPDPREALRGDGLPFPIHGMAPIEVGKPLRMLITVEKDADFHIETLRTTTPVVAIYGPLKVEDGPVERAFMPPGNS